MQAAADERRDRVGPWIEIPCPLCGGTATDPAYAREHETGPVLGRVRKVEVLCRGCGFLFSNPRPSAEAMRRHYAEASGGSGDVYHASEPGSRRARLTAERVRFARRVLGSRLEQPGGAILDVGCSTGDLLAELALPGWQRSGLEPSPSAAAKARARGLDVRVGEIETSELAHDAYELVACVSVLEHVCDVLLALSKIAAALRPEGVALLEVPDSTRPIAQIAEFYSFEHLSHFTRGTLIRALEKAGLEPIAFDEDPSIPNLRVAARRRTPQASAVEVPAADASSIDDRALLVAALERYVAERRALEQGLVERLADRTADWRARGARVAIYGAGQHTRFLMDLFDLAPSVACVLDSDPGKAGSAFLDWPVHPPAAIPDLGLDAILISSNAFEAEIYAAIAPTAEERGIEVVRCYG